MLKPIEKSIEAVLWGSRYMVLLAVAASIISALALAIIGAFDVFFVIKGMPSAFINNELYETFHREAITHTIRAIDAFLIMTVLLIFGVGLYELFISKIDQVEDDERASRILRIYSLDELKEKVAKVVVMILIVTFLKHAIKFKYETMLDILYLGIGILLIALAIHFMQKPFTGMEEKHSDRSP